MQILKQRILNDGRIEKGNILKVDSFLNHQIDVQLLNEMGKEFKNRFNGCEITRILTIESSGISIACFAAQYFNVPVVFAKKTLSRNLDSETYESEVYSYTKDLNYIIRVSKNYLHPDDNVLIIDDFLAHGNAVMGLIDLVEKANAKLAGVGIVIEKGFQEGGRLLRQQGINIQSLAVIESMDEDGITFG